MSLPPFGKSWQITLVQIQTLVLLLLMQIAPMSPAFAVVRNNMVYFSIVNVQLHTLVLFYKIHVFYYLHLFNNKLHRVIESVNVKPVVQVMEE